MLKHIPSWALLCALLSIFTAIGEEEPTLLTLVLKQADGKTFHTKANGSTLTEEQWKSLLKTAHTMNPKTEIMIRVGKTVPHASLVAVLDSAAGIGLTNLNVIPTKTEPAAAKVLQKHATAVGLLTLAKGRTVQASGKITYGNKAKDVEPIQLQWKAMDKFRVQAVCDNITTALISNGGKVVFAMGRKGKFEDVMDMSEQGKSTITQFHMLTDLLHMTHMENYFASVTLADDETVDAKDCRVVVGKDPVLGTCKFMFCKKTFELVRYVGFFFNKDVPLVVDCKQWTTVDGVKLPKKVEISLKKLRISCTIDFQAWHVGTPLEDRLFATDKPIVEPPKLKTK